LKKNLNDNQGCRWLPPDHHWRRTQGFDSIEEMQEPPIPVTGEDVVRWGCVQEAWQEDGPPDIRSRAAI
jgi:hypothetical protein